MSILFLPTNNITASYSVSNSHMRSDLSPCITDTVCINIFYSTNYTNFYCVRSYRRLCDSVTLIVHDNAINLHIHDHY